MTDDEKLEFLHDYSAWRNERALNGGVPTPEDYLEELRRQKLEDLVDGLTKALGYIRDQIDHVIDDTALIDDEAIEKVRKRLFEVGSIIGSALQ